MEAVWSASLPAWRVFEFQLPHNEPHEGVFDLGVTGDGSLPAGGGIGVDVVATAMALEVATVLDKEANEFRAFHRSRRTSVVLAPAWATSEVSHIIR